MKYLKLTGAGEGGGAGGETCVEGIIEAAEIEAKAIG